MNQTYYDEKLQTLPENLKYAVIMSDWKKSLVKIQSQFKLHIDQTQVLEDSTMKLMFGDIDAPDFISAMFNEAHINSETAADILLEVDLKILKNIRERLESIEKNDQEDDELENILLDDDERAAREESDTFAGYYDQVAKIRDEVELEAEKEGIKRDGSNITDEMLGITPEIPNDLSKEKVDLLNEINTPTKSFIASNAIQPKPAQEATPIPVDHQLENTHLEEPYHQDEPVINQIQINKAEPQPTTTQTTTPISVPTEPKLNPEPKTEIKKPININLSDIYREPIE